jgi:hypothetical protein
LRLEFALSGIGGKTPEKLEKRIILVKLRQLLGKRVARRLRRADIDYRAALFLDKIGEIGQLGCNLQRKQQEKRQHQGSEHENVSGKKDWGLKIKRNWTTEV